MHIDEKIKEERVFVVGNGPSLAKMNLDLMTNEYSIAMNRIANIYPFTEWRPSHFVCTTSNIENSDWEADIKKSIELGMPSLIWDKIYPRVSDYPNTFSVPCFNGDEICNDPPIDWWSDDLNKGFCKFGTSMLVALQWAVSLGFKEIYIIGADLGFKSNLIQKACYVLGFQKLGHLFDKNHFFSSYGTPGASPKILNNNMLAAHKLAKKACLAKDVKIYNASLGGNLEIYERVDFLELFKV